MAAAEALHGDHDAILDETFYLRALRRRKERSSLPRRWLRHSGKLLQLPESPAASLGTNIYRCSLSDYDQCNDYVSTVRGLPCQIKECPGKMTVSVKFVVSSGMRYHWIKQRRGRACTIFCCCWHRFCAGCGELVTYTIMDDLKVAPMSTISGITLLNTFGVTDISARCKRRPCRWDTPRV
uniref:Uncharacterized protein n=1 Tax=Leersia perrieri TaxID=77586 RepID=A0A0D9UWW4_9ORYZ